MCVSAYTLTNWWYDDRAKFGMEGYSLHELRHTYLTLLTLSGVHPKVMQELAGHHSSKITMDIYAHVNMDAKRRAMSAVSKVFCPLLVPRLRARYNSRNDLYQIRTTQKGVL